MKSLLAIFSIVGGFFALVAFDIYSNHNYSTLCFFKLATGVSCPGCGMGRATLELMKGNIFSSFDYNILGVPFNITIFIALLWLLTDFVKGKETFFYFIKHDIETPYKLLFLALMIIHWTTNIIRQI
jgi:hypothetical protein